MCEGCCSTDVSPSPNDHDHEVGAPVDVSVNRTWSGAGPEVGEAVKAAARVEGWEGDPKVIASMFMDPPWYRSVIVCRPAGTGTGVVTVVYTALDPVFGTVTVTG